MTSRTMSETLLPTTLVGSYPQPDWLIDRPRLSKQVPRVRAQDLWRIDPQQLEAAQDDATLLAIRDQERAGLDIITDGEQRRESYSNRFATALAGIDLDHPGRTPNRSGGFATVPRVVGPIRRQQPVEVRDVEFLRANTDRTIKMTVPGPFTMSAQCQDDFYGDAGAPRARLCGRGQRRDQGSVRRRRRHRADRRAVDAVAPGTGPRLRPQGARPRARGRRRHHRRAYLLRLCRGGEGQALRLFIPGGVRAFGGRPGLDRGRPAQARSFGLATIAVEDDHSRRDRPLGSRRRDAGNRGRRAFARRCRLPRPSGSWWRRIAASNIFRARSAFGKMRAMVEGAEIVRGEISG